MADALSAARGHGGPPIGRLRLRPGSGGGWPPVAEVTHGGEAERLNSVIEDERLMEVVRVLPPPKYWRSFWR